jgi:hypothetical protein
MSDHSELGSREVARRISRQAHLSTSRAVLHIARAVGAQVITQPVWPGASTIPDYAEPSSGLRIARALEDAASDVTRDYIRYAREAGIFWEEIGAELGLQGDPPDRRVSLADKAFDFAIGAARPAERSRSPAFEWECPECGELISDYGPSAGSPQEQEAGHAAACQRMATLVARWRARPAKGNDI